jgi:hypothetical protein
MNSEAAVEAAAEKTRRIDNLYQPTAACPALLLCSIENRLA